MNKKMGQKNRGRSILVAISGGVDSATTVYLLKKQGYKVQAVHFVFYSDDNISKVKKIAKKLDIKLHIINLRSDFKKKVIKEFLHQYKIGNTPNPCANCNRFMKFHHLVKLADKLKIEYIATGHYAQIADSYLPIGSKEDQSCCHSGIRRQVRYPESIQIDKNYHIDSRFRGNDMRDERVRTIKSASDKNKDQTYFLWNLKPEWLERIIFPLGNYQKKNIKKTASKFNLNLENQKESQEVCFMAGKNLKSYLEKNLPNQKSGTIKNLKGEIIGNHIGLAFFTIGQRTGISKLKNQNPNQKPMYVIKKNIKKNILVVDQEKHLFEKKVQARNLNFFIDFDQIKKLSNQKKLYAKIRYGHKSQKIEIKQINHRKLIAEFYKPQRAITPGQSLVFYNNTGRMLGGGIIH